MSEMKSWAERIPAALAKAEKVLEETCSCSCIECRQDRGGLTKTEIALAKALWEVGCQDAYGPGGTAQEDVAKHCCGGTGKHICPPCAALRAFVEEVEAL